MATYRPRSLDDINNSYDNEIKAEQAIRREASRIKPEVSENASTFNSVGASAVVNEFVSEKNKNIEDISPAVDELLKQFSQKKEPKKASKNPRPLHGVKPTAQTAYSTAVRNPSAPVIASSASKPNRSKPTVVSSNDTKSSYYQKKSASDYESKIARDDTKFSALMSDYVKIMTDQDDEEERASRSVFRKKNRKKSAAEPVEEAVANEEPAVDYGGESSFEEPKPLKNEFASDKPSIEVPVYDEPQEASEQQEQASEQFDSQIENSDYGFENADIQPTQWDYSQEYAFEDSDEALDEGDFAENDSAYSDEFSAKSDFEEPSENFEPSVPEYNEEPQAQNSEDEPESDFEDESKEESTVDFDDEKAHDYATTKKHGAKTFFKVIFSLILAVCVVATAAIGSLVVLFHVNEVKQGIGGNYYFTSESDFDSVDIKSGDLVICSNGTYAQGEEAVVYVDRESQRFTFGMKDSAVTAEDGDIYYIVDEQAIARDNVVGAVVKTIPTVGSVITVIYSYYTVIIVALFAACILLFVLLITVFKNQKTRSGDENELDEASIESESEASSLEGEHQQDFENDAEQNELYDIANNQAQEDGDFLQYEAEDDDNDDLFSDL